MVYDIKRKINEKPSHSCSNFKMHMYQAYYLNIDLNR